MMGQFSSLFFVVGALILVGQLVFQLGFARLSSEQRRQVLRTFEPRGRTLWVIAALVVLGIAGVIVLKRLWFAAGFSVSVAVLYGYIALSNIGHARRLNMTSGFVRTLWLAGALRVVALLAIAAALLFAFL